MSNDPYMGGIDAVLWHMEGDPRLRGTAVTVLVLDEAPDWDRFTERMERVSRLTPHMRERVIESPMGMSPPRWVVDGSFDIDYHLRRVAAPAPGDLRSVLDLAQRLSMTALDREHALWEYTLVEGVDGDGAALIQKIHHSISDGVGGMESALFFFDLEVDPPDPGPMPEAPEAEEIGSLDIMREQWKRGSQDAARRAAAVPGVTARWLGAVARDPRGTMADLSRTVQSTARLLAPVRDRMSPVMTDRSLKRRFDVLDVDLAELKSASRSMGGTVNDGFLAGLCAGLARYHRLHGAAVEELRVTVPMSIRADDDPEGGNRITSLRYPVPVEFDEVGELVGGIHDATVAMLAEPGIEATDAVAGVLGRLPQAAVSGLFGGMLCNMDFVASNVPGFPDAPYVSGARAGRWYAFGPTEGAALNVTLLSHAGSCCIGVNSDAAAIPDAETLMTCLREGYDDVLAGAPTSDG
jgi:WS/DGAT/MGAT family acyltransferase